MGLLAYWLYWHFLELAVRVLPVRQVLPVLPALLVLPALREILVRLELSHVPSATMTVH
jgi:hypothetical protein